MKLRTSTMYDISRYIRAIKKSYPPPNLLETIATIREKYACPATKESRGNRANGKFRSFPDKYDPVIFELFANGHLPF